MFMTRRTLRMLSVSSLENYFTVFMIRHTGIRHSGMEEKSDPKKVNIWTEIVYHLREWICM